MECRATASLELAPGEVSPVLQDVSLSDTVANTLPSISVQHNLVTHD